MNKINTFKGDFFFANNSKEIWTTDMVTGPVSEKKIIGNVFLQLNLSVPLGTGMF